MKTLFANAQREFCYKNAIFYDKKSRQSHTVWYNGVVAKLFNNFDKIVYCKTIKFAV